MKATCGHCGKKFEIMTGHYNRAMSSGLNVYCSRKHSGLGRRVYQSVKEKKELKATYDVIFRLANEERIRQKKAEYFKKDYAANPEKYRKDRRRRKKSHSEYCRQPRYKDYKKGYDRSYRAKKVAGPFSEAYLILLDLQREIDIRDAKRQNNIINKYKKRKRQWQKMQPKMQIGSLLNA